MGLIYMMGGGVKSRVPLPERKKVCFWLGAKKKKFAQVKKTIAPLHVSSGQPLINGKPVKMDHSQSIEGISIKQCFINR